MKRIGFILILAISIFQLTGCGCERKEESKPKQDDIKTAPEDVIQDQTVGIFTFKNTSLVYDGIESTLETVVTNTSDKDEKLVEFKITLIKDKETIAELIGFVGSTLKANESKTITTSTSKDITMATEIVYEVIK